MDVPDGSTVQHAVPTRRFLFVMFNGGGNVPAQLSIARRLVARGHAVHVLADHAVERHAVASGCHFHPFRYAPPGMSETPDERLRAQERESSFAKLKRAGDEIMFGPAPLHARDVCETLDEVAPHTIAVDCLMFGAMAAAEWSAVPSAVLTHFPLHGPVAGATPGGLGLAPAHGWWGRLRDGLFDVVKRRVSAPGLRTVNATRASLGLAPLADVFEQLLRLDRSLMLMPREFDFVPGGLPPTVQYVGAQLDDPVLPGVVAPAADAESGRPLVLLSLGSTYQAQERPFARSVEALGTLPVRALASHGLLDAPAGPTPDNVQVTRWLAHGELIPKASAMVCHGGLGTIMKALSHGVPLVVIPLGRDQHDNASRVEVGGVGVRVSPSASSRRIAQAVRTVLEDRRYRAQAQRMAAHIARDVARDAAVAELEALATAP
jgi:UDP:flavonoid glycosyltransferase YjiC (YdhE family)